MLNITKIPAPRVPFVDARTGLMSREWYRFFLNLYVLVGDGGNPTSLEDLQLGPASQPPDFTEILRLITPNIAPQYEDQSGDFLKTLDTAQLMSMMARFENAETAIQGAYLQPVVQTGTIANYNLDGAVTAGGVVYGTGASMAVSAAGTTGQVLTSATAGTPTWTTPTTGTVTAVSVVSANGLAGTSSGGATPALTLSTTVTGVIKGNGTALSAAAAATDYVAPSAYASANGLTMATSRLLGRTTASTGAAEEISVAGGLTLSGGTLTGAAGTVTSVTATAPIVSSGGATPVISVTASALTKSDDTNVTLTLGGSPTTALLAAASITAGWTGTLSPARGGTGIANNAAMTVTGSGNFAYTRTLTAATNVTFPTSGTLYGTATSSITSAQLATSMSDETGTGVLVFGTSPTITTPNIVGVTDGSNATAGSLGQYVVGAAAGTVVGAGASATYKDIDSIALTKGDWDITLIMALKSNGAAVTYFLTGISTSSGNAFADFAENTNVVVNILTTFGDQFTAVVANYRVTNSTDKTYYAKAYMNYTIGTPNLTPRISARRIR